MATLKDNYQAGIATIQSPGECFAQSMTALSNYTLTQVGFKLYRVGSPSGTIIVSLRLSGGAGGVLPIGDDLATATLAASSVTTDEAGAEYVFTLSTSYPIVTGSRYALLIKGLYQNDANQVKIWSQALGSYTGGITSSAFTPFTEWTGLGERDTWFKMYGITIPGHYWVEGTEWHYISEETDGVERYFEGALTGTTGKVAGHYWIEGTYFHYIDSSGAERRTEGTLGTATGKVAGHLWVESTGWRYIDANGDERYITGTLEP